MTLEGGGELGYLQQALLVLQDLLRRTEDPDEQARLRQDIASVESRIAAWRSD